MTHDAYNEVIKKQLVDFIDYFKKLGAKTDPFNKKKCDDAIPLLEAFVKKIDSNTFDKTQATDLMGTLTKGIGDWAWPPDVQKEIDTRNDALVKMAYYVGTING